MGKDTRNLEKHKLRRAEGEGELTGRDKGTREERGGELVVTERWERTEVKKLKTEEERC